MSGVAVRYENLRWLLVVAGIALLIIVRQTNLKSEKSKPVEDQPPVNIPELIVENTPGDVKGLNHDAPPLMNQPNDFDDRSAELQRLGDAHANSGQLDLGPDDFQLPDENQQDSPEEMPSRDMALEDVPQLDVAEPVTSEQAIAETTLTLEPMPVEETTESVMLKLGYRVTNPMLDQMAEAPADHVVAESVIKKAPRQAIAANITAAPTTHLDSIAPVKSEYAFEPASIPTPVQQPLANGNKLQRDKPRHITIPEGVQTRAAHHIEYGKSLARRGAFYAARQEFYSALRLVAESVDNQTNSKQYSEGLVAAFIALKEADDFYREQGNIERVADVAEISISHRTQAIHPNEKAQMSAAQAMQAYYAYAQDLLVQTSGHSVVAGEALFCLGRLYTVKASNDTEGSALDYARAIVHHRAALDCDQNHYRSANEIGVLLAKTGQLQPARDMFKRSLRIHQMPQTWNNLAIVHQRLGEMDLAKLANDEYQRLLSGPPMNHMAQSIQWVTPTEFGTMGPEEPQVRTAKQQTQSGPDTKPQAESKSNFFGRLGKKLF